VKILYLLNDGASTAPDEWIDAQAGDHQVEVIDLLGKAVPYDVLVDKIFASDRVISWGGGPSTAESRNAAPS
jgi:hypothetical protein